MSQGSTSAAECAPSGELMRLVADGLQRRGFRVHLPERDTRRGRAIACQGPRCGLSVDERGSVTLEYCPQARGEADPKQIADLATLLLTGHRKDSGPAGHELPGITLKGIVGLEVKARGLDVGMQVYEDEDVYDVVAEIVVTNPDTEETASVRVTDDGTLLWERDYWPEAATITWAPQYSAAIIDPDKVADSIVATLTRAIAPSMDVMIDPL